MPGGASRGWRGRRVSGSSVSRLRADDAGGGSAAVVHRQSRAARSGGRRTEDLVEIEEGIRGSGRHSVQGRDVACLRDRDRRRRIHGRQGELAGCVDRQPDVVATERGRESAHQSRSIGEAHREILADAGSRNGDRRSACRNWRSRACIEVPGRCQSRAVCKGDGEGIAGWNRGVARLPAVAVPVGVASIMLAAVK